MPSNAPVVRLSQRQPVASVGKRFLTEELNMKNFITRFLQDESGVTSIEYGLIAALISVVCIVAMTAVGTQLKAVYTGISTALAAAL
jgi:pilus assembly protein Flp/PilA